MNNDRPGYTNVPNYGNQQMPQQGWQQPPQGYAQGFGQQPQGYEQTGYVSAPQNPYQQPYQQPNYQQVSYPPQQPPYGYQQNGYQTGYQPVQQPQQPQQYPYQQPNYQQGGYQPQQPPYGYQQPQYQQPQQNGYVPQGYQQFTGYGAPQPQQPEKKPFDINIIFQIVLYGVLPVLFVLAMIFAVPALKWVFVGLAAVMVAVMWLRTVVSPNMRLTLSAVYGALAVVALVSALTTGVPDDTASHQNSGGVRPPASISGQDQQMQQTGSQNPFGESGTLPGALEQASSVVPVVTPDPNDLTRSETVMQMESFLYFWTVNKHDDMISLCAPSWQSGVDEPKKELFRIMANRTLLDYESEKITGTENDTTRTVTVKVTVQRGTKAAQKYRLQVVMLKENEMWYVDPRSLISQEPVDTSSPTPAVTPTPDPNANVTSSTKLYYNADGGSRYHADPNCKSAHERYLPFKGVFTYGEVNDAKYKELMPCNVCNAPLR